jgi:TMEM175 potassium channel family protein
MTLLVLEMRAPLAEAIHGENDLWRALGGLAPRIITYVMSFITLGIFWVGQQTQLNHLARSDRGLSWIHLFFLFAVSITPFSTSLLAQFIACRAWWSIAFIVMVQLNYAIAARLPGAGGRAKSRNGFAALASRGCLLFLGSDAQGLHLAVEVAALQA